ncbi:hypothetical protein BAJUN_00080 [Bajunvirus bajun]|uniref:YspA cpYpsA-related SLOG domain-containing protein n=1 Tax=Brevundimonas phage vB_BgoS-Bajun TaxID=2948594 RepID=A0A9E7N6G5_9CAUD|nr:hypothetical protein BAJUN_00080 [Brevundimonas phage vB_BgoS-Bajun]
MRVVGCGGRVGINDIGAWAVLEALGRKVFHPDLAVAEGHAPGYDRVIGAWARKNRHHLDVFRVDPLLDGYRDDAPKQRNIRMFNEFRPTHCLGFPGGPGTRHMMDHCYAHGVPVWDVDFNGPGRFQVWEWAIRIKGQPQRGGASGLIIEGQY